MEEVPEIVKKFYNNLPKFEDGRIDYSNSKEAAVIDVLARHNGKVLLVKRSNKVSNYPEKWNVITGYFDELKSVEQKALEELEEETGIKKADIQSVNFKRVCRWKDDQIGKTWIVHQVLAELKRKPNIVLDWEHTEYAWIKPGELKNFDIIPDIENLFNQLLT